MKNNVKEWWPEEQTGDMYLPDPKGLYQNKLFETGERNGFNACLSIFNQLRSEGRICEVPDREELAKFLWRRKNPLITDYDFTSSRYKTEYLEEADAIIKYLTERG